MGGLSPSPSTGTYLGTLQTLLTIFIRVVERNGTSVNNANAWSSTGCVHTLYLHMYMVLCHNNLQFIRSGQGQTPHGWSWGYLKQAWRELNSPKFTMGDRHLRIDLLRLATTWSEITTIIAYLLLLSARPPCYI